MPQEVAVEVVKLIKEMTKGSLGNQWQGIVKSAVGQALLQLTKVHESVRVPDPGMYSQTVSGCLNIVIGVLFFHLHDLPLYVYLSPPTSSSPPPPAPSSPSPNCPSSQLWLSLAALCVIDEEHADALSSGQWLGKDGKPKAKVPLVLIERREGVV